MLRFLANRPDMLFNFGIALNLAVMMPVFFISGRIIGDAILRAGGPGLFFITMGPIFGLTLVVFFVQLFYWNRWFEARVWEWRSRQLRPSH